MLTTTRSLTREGLTDKTRVLDVKSTGGPEIVHMRERWAELQNRALERVHVAERVDHRTLAVQREEARSLGHEARADNLDRAPEVKLGPVVSGIERREERAAERERRAYVPLTERGAQVHEARAARSLLAELGAELGRVRERVREELARQAEQVRERAQAARATYAHAREEGADRVSARLAALRAAAQKQGIGHGEERGREAARESIEEGLARLRQAGPERAHGTGKGTIEEQLARLREPEPAKAAHGLEHVREQFRRILERDNTPSHEDIRRQLNEALGRAKPVTQEREKHEREGLRHGQRVRGQGHGWGL